jgi:hypothetical protein
VGVEPSLPCVISEGGGHRMAVRGICVHGGVKGGRGKGRGEGEGGGGGESKKNN